MHRSIERRGRRRSTRAVPISIVTIAVTMFAPAAFISSAAAADGLVATNTTVTASPQTSNVGASVTLTSSTTISGVNSLGVTPTGNVTFKVDSTVLATVPLQPCFLSPCIATYSTSALPRGDHTITATYNHSGLTASSSGTTPVHVQLVGTQANPDVTTCPAHQTCDTGTIYADDASSTIDVKASASNGSDTIDAYLGGAALPCSTTGAGELGNYDVSATDVDKTITYTIYGSAATAFNSAHPTTPPPHVCYLSTLGFSGYYPSGGHWTGTSSDYANGVHSVPYNSSLHGYLGLLPQCNSGRSNSPCVISQTYTAGSGSTPPQVVFVLDEEFTHPCDPHIGG